MQPTGQLLNYYHEVSNLQQICWGQCWTQVKVKGKYRRARVHFSWMTSNHIAEDIRKQTSKTEEYHLLQHCILSHPFFLRLKQLALAQRLQHFTVHTTAWMAAWNQNVVFDVTEIPICKNLHKQSWSPSAATADVYIWTHKVHLLFIVMYQFVIGSIIYTK